MTETYKVVATRLSDEEAEGEPVDLDADEGILEDEEEEDGEKADDPLADVDEDDDAEEEEDSSFTE